MDDELDEILYRKFDSIEDIPEEISKELESIIHNRLYAEEKKEHYSIAKIITIACASIILTAGIVYAGSVVSNKIWKQPEKVVGFYDEGNKNTITEEERDNAMSEKEAREKVKELLKKFGHKDEQIKLIRLDNNPNDYELTWYIQTDNGTNNENIIEFDARGENSFGVMFQDALNENIHNYRTTEEEAVKTARDLCKKYGYDTEKYNKVKVLPNLETEEESYMWYVDFYKEYDRIINPYESISIGFVPEINDIYYFHVKDLKYENNSIEITEEQAKEIALEAETKINTGYEIKNININLGIKKMNGDAYKRINDYEQYYKENHTKNYPSNKIVSYRTDTIVRKVWKVTIEYEVPQYSINTENTYNPLDRYYTYYVDTTTGEIIGGIAMKLE